MSNELITRDEFAIMQGLAKTFLTSGLFKDTQSVEAAVVKMMAGRELKMGPFEAMRNLNIIQGQVTLTSGAVAARIKGSGKYDYRIVKNEDDCCELEFFQDGKAVGTSRFDKADATAAGLLGKDIWKKYARNMYFARALTNGARWYCAEVFGGPIYTPEELGKANAIEVESSEVITPKKNLMNGGIHPVVDPNTVAEKAAEEKAARTANQVVGEAMAKETVKILVDENPHFYVIEGVEVDGVKADICGKAITELSLKQMENAMKPKNAGYTTERDKVNIKAVLSGLEAPPKAGKGIMEADMADGPMDEEIPEE